MADDVTNVLSDKGDLEVIYGGFLPLDTNILVALKGVPPNLPMDDIQKLYFEQVVTDYLEKQTLGISNAPVIGSKIIHQHGPNFQIDTALERRQLLRATGEQEQNIDHHRRLQAEQNNQPAEVQDWIEFNVEVLAQYQPPYSSNAPFKDIVSDAFRYDRDGFIYDLKEGKSRPGSIVQGQRGDFFQGLTHVSTRDPVELTGGVKNTGRSIGYSQALTTEDSVAGMDRAVFVCLCIGAIAATLLWLWWYYVRERKEKEDNVNDKEVFEFTDSSGHHHKVDTKALQEVSVPAKGGKKVTPITTVPESEKEQPVSTAAGVVSPNMTKPDVNAAAKKNDDGISRGASFRSSGSQSATDSRSSRYSAGSRQLSNSSLSSTHSSASRGGRYSVRGSKTTSDIGGVVSPGSSTVGASNTRSMDRQEPTSAMPAHSIGAGSVRSSTSAISAQSAHSIGSSSVRSAGAGSVHSLTSRRIAPSALESGAVRQAGTPGMLPRRESGRSVGSSRPGTGERGGSSQSIGSATSAQRRRPGPGERRGSSQSVGSASSAQRKQQPKILTSVLKPHDHPKSSRHVKFDQKTLDDSGK